MPALCRSFAKAVSSSFPRLYSGQHQSGLCDAFDARPASVTSTKHQVQTAADLQQNIRVSMNGSNPVALICH